MARTDKTTESEGIRIGDGYVIGVDSMNYTLFKTMVATKGDNKGSEYLNPIGYYTTLKGALEGCLEYKQRMVLSKMNCNLEEAIRVIKEIKDDFMTMLYKIPDIGVISEGEKN